MKKDISKKTTYPILFLFLFLLLSICHAQELKKSAIIWTTWEDEEFVGIFQNSKDLVCGSTSVFNIPDESCFILSAKTTSTPQFEHSLDPLMERQQEKEALKFLLKDFDDILGKALKKIKDSPQAELIIAINSHNRVRSFNTQYYGLVDHQIIVDLIFNALDREFTNGNKPIVSIYFMGCHSFGLLKALEKRTVDSKGAFTNDAKNFRYQFNLLCAAPCDDVTTSMSSCNYNPFWNSIERCANKAEQTRGVRCFEEQDWEPFILDEPSSELQAFSSYRNFTFTKKQLWEHLIKAERKDAAINGIVRFQNKDIRELIQETTDEENQQVINYLIDPSNDIYEDARDKVIDSEVSKYSAKMARLLSLFSGKAAAQIINNLNLETRLTPNQRTYNKYLKATLLQMDNEIVLFLLRESLVPSLKKLRENDDMLKNFQTFVTEVLSSWPDKQYLCQVMLDRIMNNILTFPELAMYLQALQFEGVAKYIDDEHVPFFVSFLAADQEEVSYNSLMVLSLLGKKAVPYISKIEAIRSNSQMVRRGLSYVIQKLKKIK